MDCNKKNCFIEIENVSRKKIKIDKCLKKEVEFLTKNNIEVISCCCGQHEGNTYKTKPYIQVREQRDVLRMNFLKYEKIYSNDFAFCFKPKTRF